VKKNPSSDSDSLKSAQRESTGHPFKRIGRSFIFAGRGVVDILITQTNAWVHLFATLVVVAAGLFFSISVVEWSLVTLAIGLVWGLEGLNTALERLADALHPDQHPLVGQSKDAASGAVLLGAIAAAVVGLLIFLPKVAALFFY
jgi:diacylglycerol kinase (ATP)